ncbi:hypothetical protein SGLAM104S_04771 [Streptomyces glaucescens]
MASRRRALPKMSSAGNWRSSRTRSGCTATTSAYRSPTRSSTASTGSRRADGTSPPAPRISSSRAEARSAWLSTASDRARLRETTLRVTSSSSRASSTSRRSSTYGSKHGQCCTISSRSCGRVRKLRTLSSAGSSR